MYNNKTSRPFLTPVAVAMSSERREQHFEAGREHVKTAENFSICDSALNRG